MGLYARLNYLQYIKRGASPHYPCVPCFDALLQFLSVRTSKRNSKYAWPPPALAEARYLLQASAYVKFMIQGKAPADPLSRKASCAAAFALPGLSLWSDDFAGSGVAASAMTTSCSPSLPSDSDSLSSTENFRLALLEAKGLSGSASTENLYIVHLEYHRLESSSTLGSPAASKLFGHGIAQ